MVLVENAIVHSKHALLLSMRSWAYIAFVHLDDWIPFSADMLPLLGRLNGLFVHNWRHQSSLVSQWTQPQLSRGSASHIRLY